MRDRLVIRVEYQRFARLCDWIRRVSNTFVMQVAQVWLT